MIDTKQIAKALMDSEHLAYITELFQILRDADLMVDSTPLIWSKDGNGRMTFAMVCSDTFAWGCADAEEIALEDLPMLRGCLDDLKAAGDYSEVWLAELYCARKRGMRPMNRWMQVHQAELGAAAALIEAAGPERESMFGAP
jgi:hypothetical protein